METMMPKKKSFFPDAQSNLRIQRVVGEIRHMPNISKIWIIDGAAFRNTAPMVCASDGLAYATFRRLTGPAQLWRVPVRNGRARLSRAVLVKWKVRGEAKK